MALTEVVEVHHERAKAPRIERISSRVRLAVDAMVFKGLHRSEAAKTAGIADHTLYQALRKPSVLAYLNSQMGVLRTSARARAVAKAEQLMDSAKSETVQLEALKYIEPPVAKTENVHVHQGLTPGLTIVFNALPPVDDAGPLITHQQADPEYARIINALPKPVPHPAERNVAPAVAIDTPPVSKRRAKRGPGGQK